jgi:hypothetical protein
VKRHLGLTLAVVVATAASGFALQLRETEEGPVPKEKWKSEYTEKTWGLKLKTVKYATDDLGLAEVRVVFEFTKDLDAEEVKSAKEAFTWKTGKGKDEKEYPGLQFCFFDQDDVLLLKVGGASPPPRGFPFYVIEGDFSGKKGDAIRCRMFTRAEVSRGRVVTNPLGNLLLSPERAKSISKVELRPQSPREK